MYYKSQEIEKEYYRLTKLYPDIPEIRHPLINVSDALRAYLSLADYFTDPTSEYTETMLVGLRSADLLYSTLTRQVVSYQGHKKYTNDIDICSALFFGMVKNHSFSDGNKRTALLTLLYQLNMYSRFPICSVYDFEKLVVAVAANELPDKYRGIWKKFEDKDDPEIKTISYLLRRMTDKKDHSFHLSITTKGMVYALQNYGVDYTLENGKIQFQRTVVSKWFKSKESLKYTMVFGGWSRQIGAQTTRDILKTLELYDQFPNYQAFIDGQEPYYSLISKFEIPLRRLKDE